MKALNHLFAAVLVVILALAAPSDGTAAPDICDLFPWWPGCQTTAVSSLGD